MTEFATHRRITAVWTVVFERVEGGVKILAYDRSIERGYDQEDDLPKGHLREDKERTVTHLVLGDDTTGVSVLAVINPAFVFSYGDGGF